MSGGSRDIMFGSTSSDRFFWRIAWRQIISRLVKINDDILVLYEAKEVTVSYHGGFERTV